ncbi:hypothetical protein AUR64_11655 [Haloprofundus marisrubri]|uniref:DUF7964 domain-containing protein n=1 Tax=Haloprofundus marisrubri TaxID=1514971 RepID=A0A0W1RA24_9EURY|nr:hypothetical protein [Haloprofundus marisrubri]KTG10231.1 hypothetical protein AUR64_11655 [Haloprofundus marisrubri]
MSILDSLPNRPLSDAELASLNRAEAVELAIAVDEDGPTEALLLATESWVKALVFDRSEQDSEENGDTEESRGDGGWRTVETVTLEETERYEALKQCEETVRSLRA